MSSDRLHMYYGTCTVSQSPDFNAKYPRCTGCTADEQETDTLMWSKITQFPDSRSNQSKPLKLYF